MAGEKGPTEAERDWRELVEALRYRDPVTGGPYVRKPTFQEMLERKAGEFDAEGRW